MMNILEKVKESIDYIRTKNTTKPDLAIVFGSGFSSEALLDNVEIRIDYMDIPNFPLSTVENHKGELIIGNRKNINIYIFSGRFHYYEGYSASELTFPVRIPQKLGTKRIVLTNAAGGINPDYNAGDIVLIKDHINMIPVNPLRGKNDDSIGPRFPDMSRAYDEEVRKQLKKIAEKHSINIKEGIYLALQGPNLETPAEYSMIHKMGSDLIGMSTVLETIVAIHGGMKVGGFSIVSNECYPPERIKVTTHNDVVKTVKKSEPVLMKILGEWIDSCL